MKTALALLGVDTSDYGGRLSRLRWRRAFPAEGVFEISQDDLAQEVFARSEVWVVVRDESALPVPSPRFPVPPPGRILLAETRRGVDPPHLHTLREFEMEAVEALGGGSWDSPERSAIGFRHADFPPARSETVARFVERLLHESDVHVRDSDFRALAFEDPSERPRPELTRSVPRDAARLLDVGCGAGGVSAALKIETSLSVTGIEKDPAAAARARARLDRVFEGDATAVLENLCAAGETYDAFLFAEILEHLEDPIRALALARRLAVPQATLVASVPNVGHVSLVRDLALGRFDPVPAGLADAGHLRWFTRSFLGESLEEGGWRVLSIESAKGAAAPRAEEFFAHMAQWPGLDRESLETYQWIAVAVAG